MQSLVSIIIPAYNNADTLQDTLRSLLKQTHVNWESIIVDDGSLDNTEDVITAIADKDSRVQFFKRPVHTPKGANACRNYGFNQSKGDYILFLDADDILSETCLQNRLKLFQDKSIAHAVVADTALLIDGEFKIQSINKDIPNNDIGLTYLDLFLSYSLPWSIMSVLWKREVIKDVLFDESLMRLQDIDFHINVLKQGLVIHRLHKIDNYYRVDTNKIQNHTHISCVLNSLYTFFEKHITYVMEENKTRYAFQKFLNYFLQYYIFPNYHSFRQEVNLLLNGIYTSGVYSKKQIILIKTQEFLVKTKLSKTKYIGMYRLNTYIKKELDNS